MSWFMTIGKLGLVYGDSKQRQAITGRICEPLSSNIHHKPYPNNTPKDAQILRVNDSHSPALRIIWSRTQKNGGYRSLFRCGDERIHGQRLPCGVPLWTTRWSVTKAKNVAEWVVSLGPSACPWCSLRKDTCCPYGWQCFRLETCCGVSLESLNSQSGTKGSHWSHDCQSISNDNNSLTII